LKEKFIKKPVLVTLDLDKKNEDGSRYVRLCYKGILSMECKDGKWRPVVFLSKSLNKTERKYEIHNKEMLVVIRGLENWRHLLEGAKYKFKVWTDHKNLEYYRS